MRKTINRAIISVADKNGLHPLLEALARYSVHIVSSGGTAKYIAEQGIAVTEVAEITDFPEILDGRVKTLHPNIHGGILADRGLPNHDLALEVNQILPIDLVIVNLYPFHRFETSDDVGRAIENIDIGGVALLRAAGKNHDWVTTLSSPDQYGAFIEDLDAGNGEVSERFRRDGAAQAFALTAQYDAMIAHWFANKISITETSAPSTDHLVIAHETALRYGENPHQQSNVYVPVGARGNQLRRLFHEGLKQGKALSHNNLVDAYAAYDCVKDFRFDQTGDKDFLPSRWQLSDGKSLGDDTKLAYRRLCASAAVIIKHATPCGIALGEDLPSAFLQAKRADPLSAFGGVIAFNGKVTKDLAELICADYYEIVLAPAFTEDALEIFEDKRKDLRVLVMPYTATNVQLVPVFDGFLRQSTDEFLVPTRDWKHVCGEPLDELGFNELKFAWQSCRSVRSNAIVITKDTMTLGLGGGQTSRLDAAHVAVMKAQRAEHSLQGSYAASDAFFPFPDALEVLIEAGVKVVVHPGGSRNDGLVHEAAEQHGITVYITGERHFKH